MGKKTGGKVSFLQCSSWDSSNTLILVWLLIFGIKLWLCMPDGREFSVFSAVMIKYLADML